MMRSIQRARRGWIGLVGLVAAWVSACGPAQAGMIYRSIAASTNPNLFSSAVLNQNGTVAFTSGGATIYTSDGTSLTPVFQGATLDRNLGAPAINDSGAIAFWATNRTGIIQPVLYRYTPGDAAPLAIAQDGWSTAASYVSINNSGTIGYARLTSNSEGNWQVERSDGTTPTVVASAPQNGTDFLFPPSMNESGDLAFVGPQFTFPPAGPGGPVKVAAADGSVLTVPLPGGWIGRNPSINDLGQVAFAAVATGDPSQQRLVLSSTAATSPTVLLNSATTPYASFGGALVSQSTNPLAFASQYSIALNNNGVVAFLASLDTGGFGLFSGANPATDKIVAVGDSLFGSTVTDIGFFRDGFNDAGQTAFLVKLANGWTSVVRADPEGSTADNPILPDATNPDGSFVFENVLSGQWFDPPVVDGFLYEMIGDSLFTGILDFPDGFLEPFEVWVGSSLLGSFGPGESVDFTGFAGGGVSAFSIRGINPLVDGSDPLAFPLQLAFNTPRASFRMTPLNAAAVPEPSALALAVVGLGGLAVAGRRRRRCGGRSSLGR